MAASSKKNTEKTQRKRRTKAKKDNNIDPFLKTTKHISKSIIFGLLFMYMIANIVMGQDIPNWYTSLMLGEASAKTEFFQKVSRVESFSLLFPEVNELYKNYEQEVYQDEQKRSQMIKGLEEMLVVNPESRDTLYSLYLLYQYAGDQSTAQEYLQRAQDVDPRVEQYFSR